MRDFPLEVTLLRGCPIPCVARTGKAQVDAFLIFLSDCWPLSKPVCVLSEFDQKQRSEHDQRSQLCADHDMIPISQCLWSLPHFDKSRVHPIRQVSLVLSHFDKFCLYINPTRPFGWHLPYPISPLVLLQVYEVFFIHKVDGLAVYSAQDVEVVTLKDRAVLDVGHWVSSVFCNFSMAESDNNNLVFNVLKSTKIL